MGLDVAVATSANVESARRQSCLDDDRSFCFRYIYITLCRAASRLTRSVTPLSQASLYDKSWQPSFRRASSLSEASLNLGGRGINIHTLPTFRSVVL